MQNSKNRKILMKSTLKNSFEKTRNRNYSNFSKGESIKIFELLYSLKQNPKKGKPIGQVGGILIKEIRYKSFRFYFITDG